MDNQEVQRFGEIQYLKGRLDELHKAYPTVSDLNRKRKLDQRIEKYLQKLKSVDEVSYHLYLVELKTRVKSKERSKKEIKTLLEDVLNSEELTDGGLKNRILHKIDTY